MKILLFLTLLLSTIFPLNSGTLNVSAPFTFHVNEMSLSQLKEFMSRIVPVYRELGVKIAILDFGEKNLFAWGAIEPEKGKWDFLKADYVIKSLNDNGIEPVIIISSECSWDHESQTLVPKSNTAYQEYLRYLVERYDGDTDFYITMGDAYPDIDESGQVTSYDWSAPDNEKQTWAKSHVVKYFQIEKNVLEKIKENNLEPTQYAKLFKITTSYIKKINSDAIILFSDFAPDISYQSPLKEIVSKLTADENSTTPPDFYYANLLGDEDDLSGDFLSDMYDRFSMFLVNAGLENFRTWCGVSFSSMKTNVFPWENQTPPKGTCHNSHCSDLSQMEEIIKSVPILKNKGCSEIFYFFPLEFTGTVAYSPYFSFHGIITLSGATPLSAAMKFKRSYAVFHFLNNKIFPMMDDEIKELVVEPQNTKVFLIKKEYPKAWIAWYDWEKEVPPSGQYQGLGKSILLRKAKTGYFKVTSLIPGENLTIGENGEISNYDMKEEIVAGVGGEIEGDYSITIYQNPVLIVETETSGEDVKHNDEISEIEEIKDSNGEKIEADAEKSEESGGSGCSMGNTAHSTSIFLLFIMLFILSPFIRKLHFNS